MKGKILAIVMVICLAFPVLTIAATNLLTNAGFETGDFTGWTIGGNAEHHGVAVDGTKILESSFPDNNFVNVNTGSYAAWATVSAKSEPPVYLELEQTLTVLPNSTYDVGFWLSIGLSDFAGIGSTYYIAVDGTEILSELKTIDSSYLHESAEYTTGPSQNSATVTFHLTGGGTAPVGFSYDDFHFNGEVPPTYTVTYNGNTNTGGSVPTDGNTYNILDPVTVLGNTGSLVKTGYSFTGWNTAANGSGISYSGGDTFAMGSSNVTLYAQWTDAGPTAIPTLSEWGMILFSLLMAAAAVIFMRKRNKMAA